MGKTSSIVGHFYDYASAYEYVSTKMSRYFKARQFSIQHVGEGWQMHRWTLIIYPAPGKLFY